MNRDFVFFYENCKKNGVMNREVFVVNHDKKNHDSRQKPHESCFFSFVRNGPYSSIRYFPAIRYRTPNKKQANKKARLIFRGEIRNSRVVILKLV